VYGVVCPNPLSSRINIFSLCSVFLPQGEKTLMTFIAIFLIIESVGIGICILVTWRNLCFTI
jgi:hypothetical protein